MDEREYDAQRKADARAAKRDQKPPEIEDLSRRLEKESDDCEWLRYYLPHVFYNPFTPDQIQTVEEAAQTLAYGTFKCRAVKRGGGKSTILRYLMLKYALQRKIAFALLLCATREKSMDAIEAVKRQLRCNQTAPLHRDYPMECHLARYVGKWPSKANNLTVRGKDVHMEWFADQIILPTFADESNSVGPIIRTMGIESDGLQGCNVYDIRPDWVLLDDLDSRTSIASVDGVMAQKIESIIDHNVAGLRGPGKRMGVFYNCTVPSKNSVAYRYSDPSVKPSFSGVRVPAIKAWPERKDMWDKYVELRIKGKKTPGEDGLPIDPFAREAHRFYEANKQQMDAGAILSDEFDYRSDILQDGSQEQISALQKCYDYIADWGIDSFMTEYQQDPPDDAEQEGTQITQQIVAKRISGLEHRELPHDEAKLVAFMDVGDRVCYFTESAWYGKAIGSITDYGTFDVPQTTTLDIALQAVFHDWRNELIGKYQVNGQTLMPSLVLIDSGDGQHMNAVYEFCRDVGPPFFPSKGMKDGWKPPRIGMEPGQAVKRGDHWALVRQSDRYKTLLYEFESTFWKQFCHARFMTPTFDENNQRREGSLAIYVCPDHIESIKRRREFTHQQVGEVWGIKKQGGKQGWIKTGKNHFQDATAGNCLIANIGGIILQQPIKQRGPRPSLAELAKKAQKVA